MAGPTSHSIFEQSGAQSELTQLLNTRARNRNHMAPFPRRDACHQAWECGLLSPLEQSQFEHNFGQVQPPGTATTWLIHLNGKFPEHFVIHPLGELT